MQNRQQTNGPIGFEDDDFEYSVPENLHYMPERKPVSKTSGVSEMGHIKPLAVGNEEPAFEDSTSFAEEIFQDDSYGDEALEKTIFSQDLPDEQVLAPNEDSAIPDIGVEFDFTSQTDTTPISNEPVLQTFDPDELDALDDIKMDATDKNSADVFSDDELDMLDVADSMESAPVEMLREPVVEEAAGSEVESFPDVEDISAGVDDLAFEMNGSFEEKVAEEATESEDEPLNELDDLMPGLAQDEAISELDAALSAEQASALMAEVLAEQSTAEAPSRDVADVAEKTGDTSATRKTLDEMTSDELANLEAILSEDSPVMQEAEVGEAALEDSVVDVELVKELTQQISAKEDIPAEVDEPFDETMAAEDDGAPFDSAVEPEGVPAEPKESWFIKLSAFTKRINAAIAVFSEKKFIGVKGRDIVGVSGIMILTVTAIVLIDRLS